MKMLIGAVAFVALASVAFVVSRYAHKSSAAAPAVAKTVYFVDTETLDPTNVYDLGQPPWGSVIEVDTIIQNDTSDAVTIRSVKSNCGCTVAVAEYVGREVLPGDLLHIPFTLDTGDSLGRKQRTVNVRFTNGEFAEAVLNVDPVGTYRLDRRIVDFGELDISDPQRHSEVVTFSSDSGVSVVSVTSNVPWVTAVPNFGNKPRPRTFCSPSTHRF